MATARSPLMAAVKRDDSETLRQLLLVPGVNVDARASPQKRTPLMVAAAMGYEKCARLLIDAGASLDATYATGITALFLAARVDEVACVRLLVDRGASVNKATDNNKSSPLYVAAFNGRAESLAALLRAPGINISAAVDLQEVGYTPLHIAAQKGHVECVLRLAQAGAALEARDKARRTPLHIAAAFDHAASLIVLLESGADMEARDEDGWTPLISACSRNASACALLLLNAGASTEKRANDNATALHYAAQRANYVLARALISHSSTFAAINTTQSTNSLTPLHLAANAGALAVARLLLDQPGVDVNAVATSHAHTPLASAAAGGHYDKMAPLLLAAGATQVEAPSSSDSEASSHAAAAAIARIMMRSMLRAATS